MALEIKKFYVDSRYGTTESNSDSDFEIQLTSKEHIFT